jgi:hypothetical protein
MSIRPKWLRDICSIIFSVYYVIYANEADEKVSSADWPFRPRFIFLISVRFSFNFKQLRKFRAVCTVEMLRTTWEKMSNPYVRPPEIHFIIFAVWLTRLLSLPRSYEPYLPLKDRSFLSFDRSSFPGL